MKKPKAPQISEKAFQQRVVQAARATGWMVYHTYDSRRSAKGFPDLVLVHPKRRLVFFLELKTDTGKVMAEQQAWIDALGGAENGGAAIVRPKDWDDWLWDTLLR